MKYSENYHLALPDGSDFLSPSQYNENFQAIDSHLKTVEDEVNKAALDRIVAKIMGTSLNVKPTQREEIQVTIPFDHDVGHRPKMVLLVVTSGIGGAGKDPGSIAPEGRGGTTTIELMFNETTGKFDGYVNGMFGDDNYSSKEEPRYSYVRYLYRNLDAGSVSGAYVNGFPLRFRTPAAASDGALHWSGHGGVAFMPPTKANSDFRIGKFSYDSQAAKLSLVLTSTDSQLYAFTVSGYVFD